MKIWPYADGDMTGRPPSSEAPPLGKKLAALRKERGFTQQQLADILGMSQSVVAYYERRADNPSLELLQKLAAFYGVPVTQLVDDAPIKAKREKPGPASALEECISKVRELPRREQNRIIEMIDVAVESAKRRTT